MDYDVVVIGAGPAGIEAAYVCAQKGLRIALIEKSEREYGGTCLNHGCIPAKYYLRASRHSSHFDSLVSEKNAIIDTTRSSSLAYLKKNNVSLLWGTAQITGQNSVNVGAVSVSTRYIIIATGSLPRAFLPVDSEKTFFAQDIYRLSKIPDAILIIGAGAIGLETACILSNLGKKIHLIEKEPTILPQFDAHLTRRLKTILTRRGLQISVSDDVSRYSLDAFDMVLCATGRIPRTDGLFTREVFLELTSGGWIKTDEQCRTSMPNMFACGDITGKHFLAYTAQAQARIAVNAITGGKEAEDFHGLASCVFTWPQLATVGVLRQEAKERNIPHTVLKSNFLRSASAYVYQDTDGFCEIVVDDEERVIGAGIISNEAAELIGVFSLAVRLSLKLDDLRRLCPIHPTISEILVETVRLPGHHS